jgi:hypothetical protein
MTKSQEIAELIEQALARSLDGRMAELREAIKAEVLDAVTPLLEKTAEKSAPAHSSGGSPTDLLSAAVASIYDHSSQADILRALLDGAAESMQRVALFVNKSGNVTAWQSRGFANESAFKGLVLSGSSGLAGRAIQDREDVSAAAAEFSQEFINTHGNPFDGNATVLPLIVRDKVVAVVYADAGVDTGGRADLSGVRVLVKAASSWLEIIALRKTAGGGDAAVAEPEPARPEPPAAPPPPPPAAVAPPAPAAAPASASAAAAKAAVPGFDVSGLSPEEQEVHKKAKRFAKLLVDEIKLYNQAKVAEGRSNKDLYRRLKEDIDKSRATYEKRFGATAAASGGYFTAEVVRILADNDASILGSDFQQ